MDSYEKAMEKYNSDLHEYEKAMEKRTGVNTEALNRMTQSDRFDKLTNEQINTAILNIESRIKE
jgi:hypothetical protein